MHSSGYDAAHRAGGGVVVVVGGAVVVVAVVVVAVVAIVVVGGFGGPHEPEKPSTGCSSIAFGATPRWPCLKSKNPTPVTVAVPLRAVNDDEPGLPHARTRAVRAALIFRRTAGIPW